MLSTLSAACAPDSFGPDATINLANAVAAPAVLIGAGDIASCERIDDELTADIVDSLLLVHPNATVFTAGDNVYPDGTPQEYTDCYEPSWGRFKDRTWATLGNHEYGLGNADASFDYFGARLGPRDLGYYSVDVGSWHLVMLNTGSRSNVPVDAGSAQEQWLRADLAATTQACVMAVIHDPRFYSCGSSGCSHEKTWVKPFWDALYEFNADVVVSGDRHHYERFALQDPDGNLDPISGIRLFIVGTGGRSVGTPTEFPHPNVEVVNDESANGVMKFTLHDNSYDWEFVHEPGKSFTDSGTGTCVGNGPVAGFTWTEDPALTVAFTDASTDTDGTVVAWSWDFGDGGTSTVQHPTHTYAVGGDYAVSLTVTDNEGATGTTTRAVPVGPQAPTADFTWAATELTVAFTDASTDSDGTVTGWSWDFGDAFGTSTQQHPFYTYAAAGTYDVILTVTDNDGLTGSTTQTVTVSELPAPSGGDVIYVTSSNAGTAGGLAFDDEDIIAYAAGTGTWSIYFDGSDVGLTSGDHDVRAFAVLSSGDLLLSLKNPTTHPDVGSIDPSDIIRFTGITGSNTSGTFSMYLAGASVGLTGEKIDAIDFAPDGRLVVSTSGSFSVPGASGSDEDLIALDAGGASWSLYFDGSDVLLNTTSDEDVSGIFMDDATGDIYLSTAGAFDVPGVSGDSSAIFVCTPGSLGSTTSCTFTPYWVGSVHGLTSNDVIGIHIDGSTSPSNTAPVASYTFTTTDLQADFTDTSTDQDGTVVAWGWDFGDHPSYTYGVAGTYTVTLTVTDNDGATAAQTQTVTVAAANVPPVASYTFTTTDLQADFTDTSTDQDGTVVAWGWDFGDAA
jgi:PKD repeat protein